MVRFKKSSLDKTQISEKNQSKGFNLVNKIKNIQGAVSLVVDKPLECSSLTIIPKNV